MDLFWPCAVDELSDKIEGLNITREVIVEGLAVLASQIQPPGFAQSSERVAHWPRSSELGPKRSTSGVVIHLHHNKECSLSRELVSFGNALQAPRVSLSPRV